MTQDELAGLFRKLGARNPDAWAHSEVQEGIPQLARFLFLRQAWRHIVKEDDPTWIDRRVERAQSDPDEPYSGVGHTLKKLRSRGATSKEVTDLVRGMQAELLFALCYLLEGPAEVEPEVADVSWALMQIDDKGEVLGSIDGLHESVLETDPTGRAMRPRPGVD